MAGFLKVGESGADCVTKMSQMSLRFRLTVRSLDESLSVADPLLENLTSSGDFFAFFLKKILNVTNKSSWLHNTRLALLHWVVLF